MPVRPRTLVPAFLPLTALALTGCGTDPTQALPDPVEEPAAHWAYGDGVDAPAHWGELSEDYALCADGSHQSPVDLPAAVPAADGTTRIEVAAASGVIADTGHTFQLTIGAAGDGTGLAHDGERYDLVQVHFHTPSEHTVDGEPADAEFHLVHQNQDGDVLVVGLMAQEGDATPALRPFLDAVDAGKETTADLDLPRILPEESSAYSYGGSLTTPPCTEEVDWLVLEQQITLSPAQLAVLTGAENPNARPTLPLGDREIDGTTLEFVAD
ncbi:carbonic anhydrase [Myceligenerans indicum]|uniref:carbonic anhydrase n=1 Tax=Myceligenerans indicum TaxID=2593663 RepID=A0ABS1LKH4_9MICO|nr:carbonic anhydrase family protein [Myceligenerans indicum]MBL0886721.1 carbonic anhydrase family protein [Myceligenerans indicum]